jgi:hypothetical protein
MSRRWPRARAQARARAGRRGRVGGHRELLGRRWRHRATAIPRRRRLGIREHGREDRENELTRARGRRLNKLMSDSLSASRRT